MSSYAVLRDVSNELRTLLWNSIKDDAMVNTFVASEQAISLADPATTMDAGDARISLWLHAVRVDEFRRNDPPVRVSDTQWRYQPLPLVLSYLITPLGPKDTPEAAQLILGNIMQTLHSNAITVISNPAEPVSEELKISLAPLTLGELTAIWEALRRPYQLSVAYQVRIARIDVPTATTQARVVERTDAWTGMP
jgi:Pvc16 N-terminal domain